MRQNAAGAVRARRHQELTGTLDADLRTSTHDSWEVVPTWIHHQECAGEVQQGKGCNTPSGAPPPSGPTPKTVVAVPSTSGRTAHPLRKLVAGTVEGTDQNHADLLTVARTDLGQREHSADRYKATRQLRGRNLLVIDDTWTTGAHAQSASAALKTAGAAGVAVLTIGRWFNPDFTTGGVHGAPWLAEHRRPGWDWQRCCLDPDRPRDRSRARP